MGKQKVIQMMKINDLPMCLGPAKYCRLVLNKVSRYKGPFGLEGVHVYEPEYVAAQARMRKANKQPRPVKFSRVCAEMMVGQNHWAV